MENYFVYALIALIVFWNIIISFLVIMNLKMHGVAKECIAELDNCKKDK